MSESSQSKVDIVLDSTMIDMFQLCEQRFDYRFNKLKTTIDKAKPLDRGSLVHVGLESYYKSLQAGMEFHERIEKMINAVDEYIATESDLDLTTVGFARTNLVENLTAHRPTDERMEIISVENSFAYVLYECNDFRIVMIGKIDLLVNNYYFNPYTVYNNLPIDHKSYDRTYPSKRMTNQFCNYANAVQSNFLLVNKVGFQTSLTPDKKHIRVPLNYDPIFLEQWKQNTIRIAKRYLECVADNEWPMNLTSCDKYNRTCEYYEVCDSSGIEAKAFKLEVNFRPAEIWDVSLALSNKSKHGS